MCFLYEKIIGFWQDRECLHWILRIQSRADTIKVNMLAIGAVVVVLLLVMKSISIPAILVLPGLLYIFDKVIQKTTKNAKFL